MDKTTFDINGLNLSPSTHGLEYHVYSNEGRFWLENIVSKYGDIHEWQHCWGQIILYPQWRALAEPLLDYFTNSFKDWLSKKC